jgi:uncharacterized protein YoxC
MLETSRDVLNLLLGISVFLIAVWLSWIFYQVGRTLQNVNRTMTSVQKAFESIGKLADKVKEKTSSAGAYLAVLLKSGQQIVEFIKDKKDKKTSKKSKATQSK